MILFIYGPDTYRSRQHLKKNIEEFKKKRDPDGFNVSVIDAGAAEDGQVLSAMTAPPFLADRRLVVVRSALGEGSPELHEQLLSVCTAGQIPESNVVILWEGGAVPKGGAAKKLFGLLAKEKFAQEFEQLTGTAFVRWIEACAAEEGATIERAAAERIAADAHDSWEAAHTVRQSAALARARASVTHAPQDQPIHIGVDDVYAFLEERPDENIFALVDAVLAQNAPRTAALLDVQYAQGAADGQLVALIAGQVRALFRVTECAGRGMNAAAIKEETGLHPFVVKKLLALQAGTTADIAARYNDLVNIDFLLKTTSADLKTALVLTFVRPR